jgi:prepilin-type N-terminal cleavage/methylation domain-containing protein
MKFLRRIKAFTLVELLVVISIIALLAGLAFPSMQKAIVTAQQTQALSNMREIGKAVQMSALESVATGFGQSWPVGSMTNFTSGKDYVKYLVETEVFKAGDARIFTASGFQQFIDPNNISASQNIAFNFYSVSEEDEGNAVFLTTKNIEYDGANTVTPGTTPTTLRPFGEKGFVLLRKGGDGNIYKNPDLKRAGAAATNLMGRLPMTTPHMLSPAG